jgi:hypothetical protein
LWWFLFGGARSPGGYLVGTFSVAPEVVGVFSNRAAVRGTFFVEDVPVSSPVHYVRVDMVEVLTGLADDQGNFINNAVITYNLKAPDQTVISSGSYAYDSGSNGNYRVTIPSTVTAQERVGNVYSLEVTISAGSLDDFRVLPRPAQYRGSS